MKFTGAEQAVRFAYNMSGREISARPTYDIASSGGKEGLSPYELHAQGAMIQSAVQRLPPLEQAAIVAYLAPAHMQEKAQAVQLLATELWPLVENHFERRDHFAMALAYCMGRLGARGLRSLARRLGVSYRTARGMRDAALRAHGSPYLRGVQMLEDALFGVDGLLLRN